MIEVSNLTKYYGSHAAIKDVSFAIYPGEGVGFLGPDGPGKPASIVFPTCFRGAGGGRGRQCCRESLSAYGAPPSGAGAPG